MAAGIEEPSGKAAGRVTITTTLTSLIPPFATILVVVVVFILEIISAEVAGALILGILVNAGLTSGTVYQTAKKTPTDQARLLWSTGPVSDAVTPVVATLPDYNTGEEIDFSAPVDPTDEPGPVEESPAPRSGAHRADVSLADEVAQARSHGAS